MDYILFGDEAGIDNKSKIFSLGVLLLEYPVYHQLVGNVLSYFDDFTLGKNEFSFKKLPSIKSKIFRKYMDFIDIFSETVKNEDYLISIIFFKKGENFKQERDEIYYKLFYKLIENSLKDRKGRFQIFLDQRNIKDKEKRKPIETLKTYLQNHFKNSDVEIVNVVEVESRQHIGIQYIDLILGVYTALFNYAENCPNRFSGTCENCVLFENFLKMISGEEYSMKNKVSIFNFWTYMENVSLDFESHVLNPKYNPLYSHFCFLRRSTPPKKKGVNLWVWKPAVDKK